MSVNRAVFRDVPITTAVAVAVGGSLLLVIGNSTAGSMICMFVGQLAGSYVRLRRAAKRELETREQ